MTLLEQDKRLPLESCCSGGGTCLENAISEAPGAMGALVLGKMRHAMPGAGAWTSCDGSHSCQACSNESCPVFFHNLTLVSPSSAPQLVYPRQQTGSIATPSVEWRLQKALLRPQLVLQGPAPTLCLGLLGACHTNKNCSPLPHLSSLGGPCELRYLQHSSHAASAGNRERSPVDCSVSAL